MFWNLIPLKVNSDMNILTVNMKCFEIQTPFLFIKNFGD